VSEYAFGWPYPSGWTPLAYFVQGCQTPWLMLPGTSRLQPQSISAHSDVRPVADLRAGPLVPRISPPRSLCLDGQAATAALTLASLEPELSWEAPAVGRAAYYGVSLYRLADDGAGATQLTTVATLMVPGTTTRARVPPGLLQPGGAYAVVVNAELLPGLEDWEAQPFRQLVRRDQAHAAAVSGLLRTP
jgi:hypothetical protein